MPKFGAFPPWLVGAGTTPRPPQREQSGQWRERLQTMAHTLLRAPAGYGKTTLLVDWHQRLVADGLRVEWLDHQSPTHSAGAESFEGALSRLKGEPSTGRRVPGTLDNTATILDQCYSLREPTFLFIDDLDLPSAAPLMSTLRILMTHPAPNLHVVMAARSKPALPLARARACGDLWELRAEALSFNDAEIAALLADSGLNDATDAQIRHLATVTEGWPIGVRLLASNLVSSMSSRGSDGDAADLTAIFDYFREEVLAGQPDTVIDFLHSTSVVDRLYAGLCDALTGTGDGSKMLTRIDDAGLFITAAGEKGSALESSAFKYHPLFAHFLRRQLIDKAPSEAVALNLRACDWLSQAGYYFDAFNHALQGNEPARAADLIDSHCDDLYSSGYERLIIPSMSKLPPGIVAEHPNIMLGMSWRYAAEWRLEQSRVLIDRANRQVKKLAHLGHLKPEELDDLQNHIEHQRIMHALVEEDFEFVEDHSESLRSRFVRASPFVTVSLYAATMFARREQFKLSHHDELAEHARNYLKVIPSKLMHIFFESMVAPGYILRGQLKPAIRSLEAALQLSEQTAGFDRTVGAGVAMILADAHYEQDNVERARSLTATYLPYATEAGFTDQLIAGWITDARLLVNAGTVEGAFETLDSATRFANERGLRRLAIFAAAERVRIYTNIGDGERAIAAAAALNLHRNVESVLPEKNATIAQSVIAMTWARVARLNGRFKDALVVANRWRQFTAIAGACRLVVQWDVAIAHLLLLTGDEHASKRSLLKGMAMAESGRLLRSFLDEAKSLAPLLEAIPTLEAGSRAGRFANLVRDLFVRQSMHGTPATTAASPPLAPIELTSEGLTVRETEILRMVGSGLLNAEIGQTLGMTEGSVKWSLQRVYDKIGVRRRTLAVQYAKRIGLIG